MKKLLGAVAAVAVTASLAGHASATPICPGGTVTSTATLVAGSYVYEQASGNPLVTFTVSNTTEVGGGFGFQTFHFKAKGNNNEIVQVFWVDGDGEADAGIEAPQRELVVINQVQVSSPTTLVVVCTEA